MNGLKFAVCIQSRRLFYLPVDESRSDRATNAK